MTTSPENTTQRDPMLHLLGSLDGGERYITGMEADGQQQFISSEVLPSQAPWEELEHLGFVRGAPVPGDDLFVHCKLPNGWRREGSDHAMHSYVLDKRGIRRVGVFYKAAFYDRRASAHIKTVGHALGVSVIYGDEPVALPAQWSLLTEQERADVRAFVESEIAEADRSRSYYVSQYEPRARALLDLL